MEKIMITSSPIFSTVIAVKQSLDIDVNSMHTPREIEQTTSLESQMY